MTKTILYLTNRDSGMNHPTVRVQKYNNAFHLNRILGIKMIENEINDYDKIIIDHAEVEQIDCKTTEGTFLLKSLNSKLYDLVENLRYLCFLYFVDRTNGKTRYMKAKHWTSATAVVESRTGWMKDTLGWYEGSSTRRAEYNTLVNYIVEVQDHVVVADSNTIGSLSFFLDTYHEYKVVFTSDCEEDLAQATANKLYKYTNTSKVYFQEGPGNFTLLEDTTTTFERGITPVASFDEIIPESFNLRKIQVLRELFGLSLISADEWSSNSSSYIEEIMYYTQLPLADQVDYLSVLMDLDAARLVNLLEKASGYYTQAREIVDYLVDNTDIADRVHIDLESFGNQGYFEAVAATTKDVDANPENLYTAMAIAGATGFDLDFVRATMVKYDINM